jgi:hypothetical protein
MSQVDYWARAKAYNEDRLKAITENLNLAPAVTSEFPAGLNYEPRAVPGSSVAVPTAAEVRPARPKPAGRVGRDGNQSVTNPLPAHVPVVIDPTPTREPIQAWAMAGARQDRLKPSDPVEPIDEQVEGWPARAGFAPDQTQSPSTTKEPADDGNSSVGPSMPSDEKFGVVGGLNRGISGRPVPGKTVGRGIR